MAKIRFSEHALPVIGDIHGNHRGLLQVLAHLKELGAENPPLVLGDLIWHGWADYDPSQVLEILLAIETAGIVTGNTDQWLLNGRLEAWEPPMEADRAEKSGMLAWKAQHLPQYREFLAGLPQVLRMTYGGRSMLVFHASPLDADLGCTPDLPAQEHARRLDGQQAEFYVAGHLHRAFTQEVGTGIHFSVGAVGKHPYEYDGIIQFAILDQTTQGIVCHHLAMAQEYRSAPRSDPFR